MATSEICMYNSIIRKNIKNFSIFCFTTGWRFFFRIPEYYIILSRWILYYESFAMKSNSIFTLSVLLNFLILDKFLTIFFANFPIFSKFQVHLTWNVCYVSYIDMYCALHSWWCFLIRFVIYIIVARNKHFFSWSMFTHNSWLTVFE